MSEQVRIRFVLIRGGTSKAVFLRRHELPADPVLRDRVILELFGSPDSRQVDGLGGADILTSKLAIIGAATIDADLDYTFGQVSITESLVSYDMNCGNISAGVGAYAVDEGFVEPAGDQARVRIHNTNTERVLLADVPVVGGAAAVAGDFQMDGVPGSGAPILLDYQHTAGGATGALLPTGHESDSLDIPELSSTVEVSLVDIGNLCVFFPAAGAGMTGLESASTLTGDQIAAVGAIQDAAARSLGMPTGGLVPIPVAVAAPASYTAFGSGRAVGSDQMSLLARVVGGRPLAMHKAYPGTAGVCTAVAARIPGTVVAEVTAPSDGDTLTIGHPSGTMPVWARVVGGDGNRVVERAAYARTARRLAEGYAFVRRSTWEG
ncbi:MAG: 3-methylitaconate isomerase [Actinomycetota bacterium]|jgi:2-methylaconitate cis-trans-isomerase PrpF|nr:3-methylitaconate isomerase [Actinomycetota bacterium]